MKSTFGFLVIAAFVLGGCSGAVTPSAGVSGTATRTAVPSATVESPVEATEGDTRTDEQGAVVFEVTPLNLDSPGETLDFEVVMNTHSVDLGWDLAAKAFLQTDSGLEVQAASWPVGNGHHYGGILSFPATTAEGAPVLEGASVLILVIRDTDVDEREFVWILAP